MTQNPPRRDGSLEAAILTATRALVAIAARSLAITASEITLPQYRVLVVLAARGPLPIGDLADALRVAPSTATRLCDRVQQKGLIERAHAGADGDRRMVHVALTSSGRMLLERVTSYRRAEIARLTDRIPSELHGELTAALNAFSDAAEEIPDEDWKVSWPI